MRDVTCDFTVLVQQAAFRSRPMCFVTSSCCRAGTRISELNTGQLRLLVRFCEMKVPGLTNKTVVGAYTKLLRTATVETDKRYEEEVHELLL